jgi:hypothetical protein
MKSRLNLIQMTTAADGVGLVRCRCLLGVHFVAGRAVHVFLAVLACEPLIQNVGVTLSAQVTRKNDFDILF